MNRVRNADEFLLRFRAIHDEYEQAFPLLSRVRYKYVGKPEERDIESLLEIHARTYFVNAFLSALNWRLDKQSTDDLPNLVPEASVRSVERGSVRYLDYLGLERETKRPLLIVETKKPNSVLPTLAPSSAISPSEAISRGLSGERLNGEWSQWLENVRDYVRSIAARAEAPGRVVITNGDWLILFRDPWDAFLDEGTRDVNRILVFNDRNDIERRFTDIFRFLEHQHVLESLPPLTPGELPFYASGQDISRVMYGLYLRYIEQEGVYQRTPVIKVAPVVLLRTRYGAWLRVESPPKDYELPRDRKRLSKHLEEVESAAKNLLADVNQRLGASLKPHALAAHYEDEECFAELPGIQEQDTDKFLLVTGDKTHYLLPKPSVSNCPYHDWRKCSKEGVASAPAVIIPLADNVRSFFASGDLHHCAHRDVVDAKASPVTTTNRTCCGTRSGRDGQAFCEIWRFEQRLCCRTCAFQDVCTKAQVFRLPCS